MRYFYSGIVVALVLGGYAPVSVFAEQGGSVSMPSDGTQIVDPGVQNQDPTKPQDGSTDPTGAPAENPSSPASGAGGATEPASVPEEPTVTPGGESTPASGVPVIPTQEVESEEYSGGTLSSTTENSAQSSNTVYLFITAGALLILGAVTAVYMRVRGSTQADTTKDTSCDPLKQSLEERRSEWFLARKQFSFQEILLEELRSRLEQKKNEAATGIVTTVKNTALTIGDAETADDRKKAVAMLEKVADTYDDLRAKYEEVKKLLETLRELRDTKEAETQALEAQYERCMLAKGGASLRALSSGIIFPLPESTKVTLVILPGKSLSNKEWVEGIAKRSKSKWKNIIIHSYLHWSDVTKEMDLETELTRLEATLAQSGPYAIFAKSAGAILALKGIAEGRLHPTQCVFVGTALKWGEERGFPLEAWFDACTIPTVCIQKVADPAGEATLLSNYGGTHSGKTLTLITIPGDDHFYSYTELGFPERE